MKALIPMAGAGSRLLPVLNKPMVVSAASALPEASSYAFIVRDFQIKEYQIDEHLQKYFPGADIIVLDHLTEGQAITCQKANSILNPDDELVIGASDNGMIYSHEEFVRAKKGADALVFTFRNNPAVLANPKAYGWVKTYEDLSVEKVSVKVPISHSPMNDHAVVGTFWFKKAAFFNNAVNKMVSQNRRINNEFYVDECINDLIEIGLTVKIFEIEHYVCWGTPNDYASFNYWESYYDKTFRN
jgi:dTDP-glucose pyrophosphorylase